MKRTNILECTEYEFVKLSKSPDVTDDDDDYTFQFDDMRSITPAVNYSKSKNQSLRRRQTIDTVQTRQYRARREHQTPLKQLQVLFKSTRSTHTTDTNDHEQVPMINKKQTLEVQRSASVHEKNSHERKKRHHHQRNSDTIAAV